MIRKRIDSIGETLTRLFGWQAQGDETVSLVADQMANAIPDGNPDEKGRDEKGRERTTV